MATSPRAYDFAQWPLQSSRRTSSLSSSTLESEFTNLSFREPTLTPATSPPTSDGYPRKFSDGTVTLSLNASFTVVFTKGSTEFKLKYRTIDVCKDAALNIRCIECSGPESSAFVHTFTSSRRPIPHLEQPATPTQKSLRVSFLEEQSIQTAQNVFITQPRYIFETLSDCARFQEAVLGFSLLFAAGVAEIKSKGRGEEAISQNIRMLRSSNGNLSMMFFTNAQRKEKKRYVSIPVTSVDSVERSKKEGRPILLKLSAENDFVAQLKAVQITFLDENDMKRFCTVLQGADVKITIK